MKLLDPTKIVDKSLKRDQGDISGLAQSIKENGLLQLPIVNQKGELIIGGRRLEAVKLLKMKEMPCIEVPTKDRDDEFRKALAENVQRKNFSPSEMVALAKQLRPQIELKRKRGRPKKGVKFTPFREKAREIVASQLNTSWRTLEKAEEIIASKDKDLIDKMDKDGKVDAVYKKLKKKQRVEQEPVEEVGSEGEQRRVQLEQYLIQVKKKIEKLNKDLVPLLEYKNEFHSPQCQKSKVGQDFLYAIAGLFGTVHVLMSKKRKEVDLIGSFKLLVQSRKKEEREKIK